MSVIQAVVLGLVQGLTEFLPVSSKTHLIVVPALLGWDQPPLPFLVLLHLGTLTGLAVYLFPRLVALLRDTIRGTNEARPLIGRLAIAAVPAAIAGLALEDLISDLVTRPQLAAFALVGTAAILWFAEWLHTKAGERDLRDVATTRDAVVIGIAQVAALFPGISRSGTTISAGLWSGLTRASAAEFSFLLAMPIIAGANILEAPQIAEIGIGVPQIAGFLTAAVSGWLAVAGLLRLLRTRSLIVFAVYCAIAGPVAGLVLSN